MGHDMTDLSNKFGVSQGFLSANPEIPLIALFAPGEAYQILAHGISPEEALLLAAWLVKIAQPIATVHFGDILDEVETICR